MSAKFRPRNYFSRGGACSLQSAIKLSFKEDRVNMVWLSTIREMFGQFKDVCSISFLVLISFLKAIAATFLVINNSQAFLLLEGLVASAVISCGHKGSFVGKEEIWHSSTFEKGTRIVSRLMKPFRYPKWKLRDIFIYTFWPRRRKLPNL